MVDATGFLVTPEDQLSLNFADAAAWRTWLGVDNQADALANIHFLRVAAGSYTMPCIVLCMEEGYRVDMDDELGYRPNGRVEAIIQDDVNSELSEKEAYFEFKNNVSDTIEDILEYSRTAGYLHITGIDFADGPQRPTEDQKQTWEVGDFWQWIIYIETDGVV